MSGVNMKTSNKRYKKHKKHRRASTSPTANLRRGLVSWVSNPTSALAPAAIAKLLFK